jgi:protein-S-isoprenylcysteine O-methyltransferase Ste14
MAVRVAALIIVAHVALAGMLFSIAGRTDWFGAWVLLGLSGAFFVVGGASMVRRNPDLVRERMKAGGPAAPGDAVIVGIYRFGVCALFIVAALDAGRYRWSHMPLALTVVGAAAMSGGFGIVWWCSDTNAYLSSVVRIQSDRGHRVVDSGPYAYVRHPMYVGLITLVFGMSLVLGSWLALAPATLAAVALARRIQLEERVLSADLDGYTDYTTRVTARLVPGIW